jgi:hypothetical protein
VLLNLRKLRIPLVAPALWYCAGCNFGDISTYDLPVPPALTVELTLRAEDPDVATALGWAGGVPDADVEIISEDEENRQTWRGVSDAVGTVRVPDVPPGGYQVSVRRLLSEAERTLAPGGVNALLSTHLLHVSATSSTFALVIPASRQRSLIVSEIFNRAIRTPAGGWYYFAGFTEIYNNADTLIYLDGKLIGQGLSINADLSPPRSCRDLEHMRVDPQGIWSILFHQFPGSGTDYPLPPGGTAVIATDAIDHRPFNGHDLSNVDFEFIGAGDVDNPAVPNMLDVGVQPHPTGRGLYFQASTVFFLADALDPLRLTRMFEPGYPYEYARIPAASILDAGVVLAFEQAAGALQWPRCAQLSHPSFDRSFMVGSRDDEPHLSLHRRPLFTTPEGRVVLQHSGSSGTDFFTANVSIGSVPRP